MDTCIIEFNGVEIVIPKSDLEWFVKEKGAKEIKVKQKINNKEK